MYLLIVLEKKKCEINKTEPLFNPGPGLYSPKGSKGDLTWKIGLASRDNKKNK